ncbi:uncharacterized protein [Aegilops tauschii subsp. strangulata]|uniref:uncharacterized protein n=1 Tax=Aegilops tauschii subsp. strangulata TaxID=200361 RepID=UPI003CC8B20A
MDKQKGNASGKEKEKERTLDSIMKRKLPVSGMQKGNGKGNAAATTRLPRKLTNDSSNVPIAELLYRVKKKPPPRCLPDPTGAGVRAGIAVASGSANYYEREATSSQAMEHDKQAEEDHEEVEEDEEEDDTTRKRLTSGAPVLPTNGALLCEEEKDTLFEVPPGVGDKSDSDGFVDSEEEAFQGDDMSEDGLGLGPTPQEQETVLLSSGEDEARKVQRKSAKKRRGQAPSRSRSAVWTFFNKVKVPSKEGLMELKAQCNYCDNQYAYVQGGSTSSMGRHMDTCKNYKDKVNRDLIQATLFFRKTNATTSGPAVRCIEYDKDLIKEVMAKMICVHEYSFRMVEHKWFNILMKCLNPNYQPIGRKAIRAECMRVFKKERELLQVALKDVDFISLTTDL